MKKFLIIIIVIILAISGWWFYDISRSRIPEEVELRSGIDGLPDAGDGRL
jgi:hypothetical protein